MEVQSWKEGVLRNPEEIGRIVETPGYLGGKPRFDGTRIGVDMILEYLEHGWTDAQVLEGWPALTPRDLEAAREFAAGASRSEPPRVGHRAPRANRS